MVKKIKKVYDGAEPIGVLLYICSMCAALMYVLCRSRVVITTLLMTVVCGGIYMLFYCLRKRKKLLPLLFLAVHIPVSAVVMLMFGKNADPSFFKFIFTSSDYFYWDYALVAILMFSEIIGLVVFYFSACLPRANFLLLPSFIPLILAARTLGALPLGIAVFLAVGYLAATLSLSKPETPEVHRYFDDPKSRWERLGAKGLLTVASALLLLIIPFMESTPYSTYLDSVFSKRNVNIYGGGANLTNFLQRSVPNRGANKPAENVLFSVATDIPQNVIRWSFDIYEGGNGWTYSETFSEGTRYWQDKRELINHTQLADTLRKAAKRGQLEEYSEKLVNLEKSQFVDADMTIQIRDGSATKVVLHPSGTYKVTFPSGDLVTYRNPKDEIFVTEEMKKNAVYMLQYYAALPNESFIHLLDDEDFIGLLRAARDEGVISEEQYSAIVLEYTDAHRYLQQNDEIPEEVERLAEEITEGLDSDYDKARAIEKWFKDADFVYDMDYVPVESTAEHFLFESKRGICTDFATATTLMLRAVGIPARYTEGFVLSEDILDEYGRYNVTPAQAHAYSTAYIKGYGWLEIDGTKYANQKGDLTALRIVLIVVVAVAAVLLVLGLIFRERMSELWFTLRFKLIGKEKRIREVYVRTRRVACRIADMPCKSASADEVRGVLSRMLGTDSEAAEITQAADILLYSGNKQLLQNIDERRLYRNYKHILKMKKLKGFR